MKVWNVLVGHGNPEDHRPGCCHWLLGVARVHRVRARARVGVYVRAWMHVYACVGVCVCMSARIFCIHKCFLLTRVLLLIAVNRC